ncbi:MAG: metal-dependent hydrolase [Bdellovibrionaceae bacterium]|nr:metal-dependent hydrolase [Pseudobdellovibrionaceae bacterium]
MDNITHSLFGIATAKYVNSKINKKKDKRVTVFLYFVSIFAANFPDLDILMSLIDPGPLGYLLHHRGHTHTFLYLVPQVFLLLLLSILGFRIKDKKVILAGVGLVSVNMCLHLFLDYQNSYGVHPFAPFNSKWFYNDNLFIIEPLLWFTMLPMLFTPIPKFWTQDMWCSTWGTKVKALSWFVGISFFITIAYLAYRAQYVSLFTFSFLCLLFLFYLLILNTKSEVSKSLVALISAAVIVQGFALARTQAYRQVYAAESRPSLAAYKIFDVILSPMPANPFCWNFLTVSSDQETVYMIKKGVYQNSFARVFSCPDAVYKNLRHGKNVHTFQEVYVEETHSAPLKSLVEDLGSEAINCKRDQWLQFVRAPLREKQYVYKDMRFERESNFTKIDVTDPEVRCVTLQVPWVPPRQDLIDLIRKK